MSEALEQPLTEEELDELLEQELAAQLLAEAEQRMASYGVKETIDHTGTVRLQTTYIRPINIEDKDEYLTEFDRNAYAEKFENLIEIVAKTFVLSNSYINFDDLYCAGSVGFVKALNGYRKDSKVQFQTYATACIRNEITDFVRSEMKHYNLVSLDDSSHSEDGDGRSKLDDISDEYSRDSNVLSMEEKVERKVLFELLSDVIEDNFEPKDQFIIKSIFGIGGIQKRTQIEIGEMLHISQAAIQKRYKKSLAKLKSILEIEYNINKLPF